MRSMVTLSLRSSGINMKRETTPYNGNQFGFVYSGNLTENVEGKVNAHPITYCKLNQIVKQK